jgi:3-phenylpropionate/trans-cinnamate dioxygenase ferredoxin subunit
MSENWHHVANTDDIEEEDVLGAKVGDLALAIYNVEGEFYATSNVCTHGQAEMSEGIVIDDIIECPLHQGRFHIPTGAPKGAPVSEALTTYPTKVEDGKVFVDVGGDG